MLAESFVLSAQASRSHGGGGVYKETLWISVQIWWLGAISDTVPEQRAASHGSWETRAGVTASSGSRRSGRVFRYDGCCRTPSWKLLKRFGTDQSVVLLLFLPADLPTSC